MKKSQKVMIGLIFLIPFFTLFHNFISLMSGCFHALDLGIYQQAILDLAFSSSWNPENTVRGIQIFADHFDPIILLAALVQRVVGPFNWVPLVVEFLIYWLSGWLVLWATKEKSFAWRVLLIMMWFFNEGIAVAMRYPVHPTTWSILPIFLLIGTFKKEKFAYTVLLMNILCLFKEYFPFGMFMYGLWLIYSRGYRRSMLVLVNALIWLFFDFYLRPRWFEGVYGHGNTLVQGLVHHPIEFLITATRNFEWKAVLFAAFPILLIFPWVVKSEMKKNWMLATLIYFLPILAIQFLFGSMRFQHGAPIFAALVSIVIWSDGEWFKVDDLRTKWVRRISFLMMIYAGGDVVVKASTVLIPKGDRCRYDSSKSDEFKEVQKYIWTLSQGTKIISSGGLVPVIIAPNQDLYQYGMWSKPQDDYDVIVIGRNGTSDLYAFSSQKFEEVIRKCRPKAVEVVLDTKNIFLAKGKFSEECLHQYERE